MSHVSDLTELVRGVRSLLAYQRDLGLRGLDVHQTALLPRPPSAPETTSRPVPAPRLSAGGVARPLAAEDPAARLAAIRAEIGDCSRCKLCKGRTRIVFGVGDPRAKLMFVGEAPGRDEDLQGEPFVGAAGQLLNKMISAMGIERRQVYIANIAKCRPPNNRDPEPDEVAACEPFLVKQIEVIQPQAIVALGRHAAQTLLRDLTPISRLRGTWREYESIPLMPTFHPAYLLRNPAEKRVVWDDLQGVMRRLGLKDPRRPA